MPTDAQVRIKWEMEIQKTINAYNKVLAKQEEQIRKLRETVRMSQKAERAGKKATRAAPSFARSITGLASMAAAIALVNRGLQLGLQTDREALQVLLAQKDARTAIGQLGSGEKAPLSLTPALARAGEALSITNAIPIEKGLELAFAIKSRLPDLSPEEIAAFPSVEFLVDPVKSVSLAADVQQQFPASPQGLKGIRKILGGLVVGAERSKLRVDQLAPILAKPSQSALELGFDFAEVVAGSAAGASGVAEANEQATLFRSLLSDIQKGKSPGSKRLKRIGRKSGLVAMLEAIADLTEKQKLRIFPEKRSFQQALFLSKPDQIEKIKFGIDAVREGTKFAAEGGNKDPIQKQLRILENDRQRQIIRTKQVTANQRQLALQRSDSTAKATISQSTADIVDAARIQAFGATGLKSRAVQAEIATRRFIGGLFEEPETTIARAEGFVDSLRASKQLNGKGGLTDEQADAFINQLSDLVFLLKGRPDTNSNLDALVKANKDFNSNMNNFMAWIKGRGP